MQELMQKLMQQAHLTEAQAQNVLNVALNFVRTHIPALAPFLGMIGGGGSSAPSSNAGISAGTTNAPSSGGGILGDIEGALGGSSSSGSSGGGGILGNIEGALGGFMSGGQSQQLHQQLVQNAGISESQAASSVNVIKDFITQHVPGAASATQEGGALDSVEDKVEGIFGIKDNQPNN